MNHPTEQSLSAWIDGEDDGAVASHVASCARCRGVADAMRSVGLGVRAWSEDAAPALPENFADQVMAQAVRGGSVVPIARARRRWMWGGAGMAIAAAAVAVLALRQPGMHARRTHTTAERVALNDTDAASPHEKAASGPRGTLVLSVQTSEHSVYSVMEVPGEGEGTTTSVVWIDEPESNP